MNLVIKIFLYLVLICSILVSMSAYFINIFYLNEEILNLPKLSSDKLSEKTLPIKGNTEKNKLDLSILKNKNLSSEKQSISKNNNEPELIPFNLDKKVFNLKEKTTETNIISNNKLIIDNNKKILPNKDKLKIKKDLRKYRVQLGSFKDKVRAKNAINSINKNFLNLLKGNKLEIFSLNKNDYLIHRVWTNLMKKDEAFMLCNSFKKMKLNCILQIDNSK